MAVNNGELLFIKSVKDGIPNRDPLNDSDARRLFPEEDGRISLSDVSVKRDVRDFVVAFEENGGEKQQNHIFVQQKMNDKGKLLGRKSLAEEIAKSVGKENEAKKDMKSVLLDHAFDVRTFGIVYSVNPKFHLSGPVQFGWAH
ncbi:CRISPR-associated protein Csh2, partial [Fischerella thermalis CCMEE 5273]|uniref:type I CRISPR-associated protein Cas7 n=1 Tax=Fischerella thermalis TaxID=372787 RepID=UPI000CB92F76